MKWPAVSTNRLLLSVRRITSSRRTRQYLSLQSSLSIQRHPRDSLWTIKASMDVCRGRITDYCVCGLVPSKSLRLLIYRSCFTHRTVRSNALSVT